MTEPYIDPFTTPPGVCPECLQSLNGLITEVVHGCEDHLTHEQLIEDYRFLKEENKRLGNRWAEFVKGTELGQAKKRISELEQFIEVLRKGLEELK